MGPSWTPHTEPHLQGGLKAADPDEGAPVPGCLVLQHGHERRPSGGNHGDRGKFKGVVTAHSPALRSSPHRGSRVIRYARKGEVVSIHCKVGGDSVQGDSLRYLLTDGTWAWGPARHIDNIGPAPRWR
ncbi:SH3 domain-containing protein [Streptomyces sp. NPDC050388]|uniref:SH3 domain-containing protein n=1 Tax=Streptomyces sp. NPDC050388 TaxID=3155781 RepID=UPI0034436A67